MEICREMQGWTFDIVDKLTVFERNSIIRIINKERRDRIRASKKSKTKR